jgi:hypothetical protein
MIRQKVITKDEVILQLLIRSDLLILLLVSTFEIVYIFVCFLDIILNFSLISLEAIKGTNIFDTFLIFQCTLNDSLLSVSFLIAPLDRGKRSTCHKIVFGKNLAQHE